MALYKDEQGNIVEMADPVSLRQVMSDTAHINPAEVSEVRNLSKRLNIPTDAIQQNRTLAKRMADAPDLDVLDNSAPVLGQMARNHNFMAEVSDDLTNMAAFEQKASALQTIISNFKAGEKQTTMGRLGWQRSAGDRSKQTEDTIFKIGQDIEQADKMADSVGGFTGNILAPTAKILGQMWATTPKALERGLQGAIAGTTAGAIVGTPTGPGAILTAGGGAAMGFSAGFTAGMAEDIYKQEGGSAYNEIKGIRGKNGEQVSEVAAQLSSMGVGTVNAALELVGLHYLTNPIKNAIKQGVRKAAKEEIVTEIGNKLTGTALRSAGMSYAKGVGGEVVTEIGQEITNIVSEEISKAASSGEFDATTAEEIGGRLYQIASETFRGTLLLGLPAGVSQYHTQRAQEKFKTDINSLHSSVTEALDAAKQMNLMKRSGETTAEYAQRVGDQYGVDTFYLQSDRLLEEAQKQGMTTADLVQWADQYGIGQEELNTTLQAGGHVELPFGKFVANLENDDLLKSLQNDFTPDPNIPSRANAENALERNSALLEQIQALYQSDSDNFINNDDVQAWRDAILATPNLNGRVNERSLDILTATANLYANKSDGKFKAIDLLNSMLQPEGLQVMKFKDWQAGKRQAEARAKGYDWGTIYDSITADVNNTSTVVKGKTGPATDSTFTKEFSQQFPSLFDLSNPNNPQAKYNKSDIQATVKNLRDGREITGKTQQEIAQHITEDVQNLVEQFGNPFEAQDLPFQRDALMQQDLTNASPEVYSQQGVDYESTERESVADVSAENGESVEPIAPNEAREQVSILNTTRIPEQTIVTVKEAQDWLEANGFPRIAPEGESATKLIEQLMQSDAFNQLNIFDQTRVASQVERPIRDRDYNQNTTPKANRKLEGQQGNVREGVNQKVEGSGIVATDTIRGCDHFCFECYALKSTWIPSISHQHPILQKLSGTIKTGEILRIGEVGDPSKNWAWTHEQVKGVLERSVKRGAEVDASNNVFYITKLLNLNGFNPETARNLQVTLDPLMPAHMWRSMENIIRLKSAYPEVNINVRIRSVASTHPDLIDATQAAVDFANQFKLPIIETRMRFVRSVSLDLLHLDKSKYKRVGNQFKLTGNELKQKGDQTIVCDEKGKGCPGCLGCAKTTRTMRAKNLKQQQKAFASTGAEGVSLTESAPIFDPVGGSVLFQSNNNPLAALETSTGENIVTLFEKADKSSFLHETGHIYLNFMRMMAEQHGIQADVWADTKQWLGVDNDGVITVAMQEKFAEHFEVYLMEGKAPTPSLREAFRSFKNWLVNIYKNIKSKRAGQRDSITMTDDVRGIFDRMLATEEEVKAAREQAALVAMLDDQVLNGSNFTAEEIADYKRQAQITDDEAKEKRDNHKLKGLAERIKAFRKQAETESKDIPVYAMIDKMARDAEGKYGKGKGINRQSIIDEFGAVDLPNLPGLWRNEGMGINEAVAEFGAEFGFESAADFVEELKNFQKRKDWVEKRAAQIEAEYVNSQETDEAIRTASLRKMLEIESRLLEKRAAEQAAKDSKAEGKAAEKATVLPQDVINQWASTTVGNWTIRQFSNIKTLLAQSKQHRQQAIKLARKGEWLNALKSNEQARLNEALIAEAFRVRNQWEKVKARWKRIDKWTNDNANVKIGQDFRDQINRLMSQYGIADKKFDPNASTLHDFIAMLAENDESGLSTVLPSWIGQEVQPFAKLKWDELNELNDALSFLYEKGREQVNGLKTSRGEFIAEYAQGIIDEQEGTKGDKLKTLIKEGNRVSNWLRDKQIKNRRRIANNGILRFIARRMGPKAEQLVQSVINGMSEGSAMWDEMEKRILPSLRILSKNKSKVYSDIPRTDLMNRYGYAWTKERVVAAALNMGNASNMQRLRDGYGLEDAHVEAIKKALTAEEWRAIQDIWNAVDSLWPKVAETHKRINYFLPKKIQAAPVSVTTADGEQITLPGGYYPAAYDKNIDNDIAQWTEKHDILASNEAILQVPVAKSGMTKDRADKVYRPLDLSLAVLATHIRDSITYITTAEAVRDADRVFHNKSLMTRNEETIGKELHAMIRPTLKNILRPEPNIYGVLEKWRQKLSSFYMAYNFWTALQNITGIFPAMYATGTANYVSGLYDVMAHPYDKYKEMLALSKYMKMRSRNIESEMGAKIKTFDASGFEINGKYYTAKDAKDIGWAGIRLVDTLVSLPAWWGKYNSEMEKHGNMQQAVEAADTAINQALGSGMAVDMTGIQRSKGFSIFYPFSSFAAMQEEVLSTEKYQFKNGRISASEYLYANMMVWVFPAVASTALKGAIMYGLYGAFGGGDDDKKKNTFVDFLTDLIGYRVMGKPFIRDAYNALVQGYEGKQPVKNARMPITAGLDIALQGSYRVGAVVNDWSENKVKAFMWTMAELASLTSGVPVSRIYDRIQKGNKQIESGDGWIGNYFIPMEQKKN